MNHTQTVERLQDYKRLLKQVQEEHSDTSPVGASETASQRDSRFRHWMAESLEQAIDGIEKHDYLYAMRCWAQQKEYVGRLGGAYPHPRLHDCASSVQLAIEDFIRSYQEQTIKGNV